MDLQVLQLIRVLGVFLLAFLIALGLEPWFYKLLLKYHFAKQIRGAEDAPVFHELHKKKEGTPTSGGLVIWITVLGIAALFFVLNYFFDGFFGYLNFVNRAETYLPIAAMGIAAIVGLIDDVMGIKHIGPKGGGLKVRDKLFFYALMSFLGALWFYFRLDWDVIVVPFMGAYHVGFWYVAFFMFIISASAFSVNITDGLDGLSGGVLLFAFTALTAVAFVLHRFNLATFSAAIIGALLAFLWYNVYPAKFFMGDTGSMALGITLGTVALLTNTALLLPFFAFIPVIETLSVIVQLISKKLRGKKIFRSTPIHHHFEAIGWVESQVTMRFWIIAAIMTVMGLVIFFAARFLS